MKRFFNFLAVLILFFCTAFPARAAGVPKIYMVLWDGCEEACRGFRDYLKSSRTDVEIIERNVQKQPEKIPALIKEVRAVSPDLLVTWGTFATLEMLGTENDGMLSKYGSVPALFMVVSQPVESGLVSALVSQGRNLTGVMHLVSVSEQLQYARQVVPFKRLGVIYNAAEVNSVSAVDQIKKYAPLLNFEVLERAVPADKNGRPDAGAIPEIIAEIADKKADLIYLGPDAFMNANRDILTLAASDAGIPVFSASEGAVRNGGALFAFVHRYYTVGQMAGQKAVKILKDKIQAYDIPIEAPQRALLVVNMEAARKLGIYPPLILIQNADLIDIPETGPDRDRMLR